MELRYAILGLLNYRSMTGYALSKLFSGPVQNLLHAGAPQIRREVDEMEKAGLLVRGAGSQMGGCRITAAGRAAFRRWIARFPDRMSKRRRDELGLLLFSGLSTERTELKKQFRRLIKEKRRQYDELSAHLATARQYAWKLGLIGSNTLCWRFMLRRALINAEAAIRWAEECLAELNERQGH